MRWQILLVKPISYGVLPLHHSDYYSLQLLLSHAPNVIDGARDRRLENQRLAHYAHYQVIEAWPNGKF
jgi:hypothetical protein